MRGWLLALGPLFIGTTFVLMNLRVEPFANFFYLFAWYGLIFTFDQLVRRRGGTSPIAAMGPGFLVLMLWSAATWYFFEVTNLRLQNWYYVFVVDQPVARAVGTFLSFATVFPGIFLIDRYLELRGVGGDIHRRPLVLGRGGRHRLQLLGVLFLALPMLLPTYFYPLVWISVFLLLAPLDYRPGGDGLLNQLERGDYGPLVRHLLAGLVAGLFWEGLNFWARAKWIYTVPFFDRLKLFEMPLAGFLGFPPFAVECLVLYRFLVWQRLAPPFATLASQRAQPRPVMARVLAWMIALVFAIVVDQWVVAPTIITSVTPRCSLVEGLRGDTRTVLAQAGITYLTALEGWKSRPLWHRLESRLTATQLEELHRVSALYLHQGIGVEYGNLLFRIGVHSLRDLSLRPPEELHGQLVRLHGARRLPTLRQVRVWVRRARAAVADER